VAAEAPPVPFTVVLSTRNRAAAAARAARAILASSHPSFTLTIVDQSDDGATRDALDEALRDPRATWIAAPPRGLAAARNAGVARSTTPLVAFTDDDCEPEPGWLSSFGAAFDADPGVGVVFGSVEAAPYDRDAGFVPAYRVARSHTVRALAGKASVEGIGACMAIRRSTWERLGGFDEQFGSGGPLRAAEDNDFAIRALIAGIAVHETPAVVVVHAGFRRWDEGAETIRGYMTGLGAVNAKMLRLAGWRAARPLASLAWRWLARGPVVDLNHRPPRLLRLRAFLGGAWRGMRAPIDARTGHFRAPSGERPR
jgi:GT2 family glycosyltransferase